MTRLLKGKHQQWILLIAVTGLLSWALYYWAPALAISGIEITVVYILGLLAVLIIILVMSYSLRKRLARGIPGRLDNWLWAHLYLGILALFIIALHAEFRFGWNYSTVAAVLLGLVIVTGVIGRLFYTRLPATIVSEQNKIFSKLEGVKDALKIGRAHV